MYSPKKLQIYQLPVCCWIKRSPSCWCLLAGWPRTHLYWSPGSPPDLYTTGKAQDLPEASYRKKHLKNVIYYLKDCIQILIVDWRWFGHTGCPQSQQWTPILIEGHPYPVWDPQTQAHLFIWTMLIFRRNRFQNSYFVDKCYPVQQCGSLVCF